MVEIGRVVLVTRGPDTGKICAIVDVVDQNRVLVDGPSSGVKRQALSFTEIALTKFRIQIPHGTGSRFVKKVWDGDEVEKKFSETRKAKQLEAAKRVSKSAAACGSCLSDDNRKCRQTRYLMILHPLTLSCRKHTCAVRPVH